MRRAKVGAARRSACCGDRPARGLRDVSSWRFRCVDTETSPQLDISQRRPPYMVFVRPFVTTEMPAPPPVSPRLREERPRATRPRPPVATAPPAATPTARAPASLDASSTVFDDPPGYIAGGSLLQGSSRWSGSQRIRLPSSDIPIVKNLPMIDPRAQGIAGVVRAMQAMLGARNPHCVDVDVWRGLSVREQLDRHMSSEQVEETAQKYSCGPPD